MDRRPASPGASEDRRRFLQTFSLGGVATLYGLALPRAPWARAGERVLRAAGIPAGAPRHRPQKHTRFEDSKGWSPHGRFERSALWPLAGDIASFAPQTPEWTALFRARGGESSAVSSAGTSGFYQIFVCRGWIELPCPLDSVSRTTYSKGDFLAGWFFDNELANAPAEPGTMLVVKRQRRKAKPEYDARVILSADHRQFSLPFITRPRDETGLELEVRSEFLLGNGLKRTSENLTVQTMLESFTPGTAAPSHFHDAPVFHEFVYLQGGHLTPDGYYGPGDHVVSEPGCKEGPWLAASYNQGEYPREWPLYVDETTLRREAESPWAPIFDDGRVYGILFVHHGPFARIRPWKLANWTVLGAHELGPRG